MRRSPYITDTSFLPSYTRVFGIYDSDGKAIYYDSDYKKYIYFDLIKNNKYYILISYKDNNGIMDYSFSLKGPVIDDCGNSIETAKEIKPGEKIFGSWDYLYDSDYYKIVPQVSGRYYLNNFKINNGIDISETPELSRFMTLLDENGERLNGASIYRDNAIFNMLKDKVYYIKFSYGFGHDLLNYSLDFGGPLEDDYGNYRETAQEIHLNSMVYGKENYKGDLDYFSFTPSISGRYYIEGFNFDTIRYEYDDEASYIQIRDSIGYLNLEKDKTYYISIGNSLSYVLYEYSFSLKGPLEDDYNADYKPEVMFNETIKGTINYNGDGDAFTFIAPETGIYYIESALINDDSINDDVSINVKISVGNGHYLNICKLSGSKYCVKLEKDTKYYIVITAYSQKAVDYSFKIYEFEMDDYGDSIDQAVQLTVDTKVEGVINYFGDIDYFSFKPSVNGLYYFDNVFIYNDLIESIFSLSLFKIHDKDGNFITPNIEDSKIYFNLKKDIVYYFQFISKNNYLSFNYSLTLKGPIADDYGNTDYTAEEIKINEKISGKIDSRIDYDYFKFIPEESGTYYIEGPSAYYIIRWQKCR